MARITALDLLVADEWRTFFKRLGWKLYDIDTEAGVARRDTGERKKTKGGDEVPVLKRVTAQEKEDIQKTWHPSNQATVTRLDGTNG